MDTVRMNKDFLMSIRRWLKENKIDEIWVENVDDNHLKVRLLKKVDGELWAKSVLIDVRNFPDSRYQYFEKTAAWMNYDIKNNWTEAEGYDLVNRKLILY